MVFFSKAELCFIDFIYHVLFISSSADKVNCFHVLGIVNNVAIKEERQLSLLNPDFNFFYI